MDQKEIDAINRLLNPRLYGQAQTLQEAKMCPTEVLAIITRAMETGQDNLKKQARDENKKVAVISDDVYKQLFEVNDKSIGEFIKINEINYKIIGVFEQGDFDFGGQLHIPFTTFQSVCIIREIILAG